MVAYSARGAIDLEKLNELVDYMREAKKPMEMIDAVIVCWSTGLRTSQMSTVRVENFHLNEETGAYTLTLAKIHDPTLWTKRDGKSKIEVRPVELLGSPLITRALRGKTADQPLYPGWQPRAVCMLARACAAARGWPTQLKWDGAHRLRHGVATYVRYTRGMEAARGVTGHEGHCVMRYVRSNRERLEAMGLRFEEVVTDDEE